MKRKNLIQCNLQEYNTLQKKVDNAQQPESES